MDIGASLIDPMVKAFVTALASLVIKYISDKYRDNRIFQKKKQISDLKELLFGLEKTHPAIIEEQVSMYLGCKFRCSEILLVMSLKNPMHTFNLLKSGRTFLIFDEEKVTYQARESISSEKMENISKMKYGVMYFIFAFMALFPLLLSPELIGSYGVAALVTILVWSLSLFSFAISMLEEGSKIYSAKKALEQLSYRCGA